MKIKIRNGFDSFKIATLIVAILVGAISAWMLRYEVLDPVSKSTSGMVWDRWMHRECHVWRTGSDDEQGIDCDGSLLKKRAERVQSQIEIEKQTSAERDRECEIVLAGKLPNSVPFKERMVELMKCQDRSREKLFPTE